MRWSNFETPEGQIISIDIDELVAVINYPGDRADLCLKNGTLHTVIFMGQWKTDQDLDELHPINEVIQDLKLENDRLKKRDDKMRQVIRAIACDPDCEFCLLRGSDCSDSAMRLLAMKTLDELEEL